MSDLWNFVQKGNNVIIIYILYRGSHTYENTKYLHVSSMLGKSALLI